MKPRDLHALLHQGDRAHRAARATIRVPSESVEGISSRTCVRPGCGRLADGGGPRCRRRHRPSSEMMSEGEGSPVVKLANLIIYRGHSRPRRLGYPYRGLREVQVIVRYRMDGVMKVAMTPPPKRIQNNITWSVESRSCASLDIAERRSSPGRQVPDQGGRPPGDRLPGFDRSPPCTGEKVVMRILDSSNLATEPGRPSGSRSEVAGRLSCSACEQFPMA